MLVWFGLVWFGLVGFCLFGWLIVCFCFFWGLLAGNQLGLVFEPRAKTSGLQVFNFLDVSPRK